MKEKEKERKKKKLQQQANTSGNDDKRLRASHARCGSVRLTFLRQGSCETVSFPLTGGAREI